MTVGTVAARAALALAVALGVAAPAASHPGLDLTIAGPPFVRTGEPQTYSGRFQYYEAAPVPGAEVELLVDEQTRATALTGPDGRWEATVTFDDTGGHWVRAIAVRGTFLETPSWSLYVQNGEPLRLAVAIERAEARRVPGAVEVDVALRGTVQRDDGTGIADATVDGLVHETSPALCWPDTPCIYPYDDRWGDFYTKTDATGAFAATVTFRFESIGAAEVCTVMLLEVRAFHVYYESRASATAMPCA